MRKRTHEEYLKIVAEINPNIEVLDKYIDARTKITHKCKICGYILFSKPSSILSGFGCPKCAGVLKLTHEEYKNRIEENNLNIEALEKYINMNTKILHKCKTCGHEWKTRPVEIINGHGCPVCTHKCIGNPPEYKNSIWASDYNEYFSKYLSEGQMKLYMPYSSKKIEIQCPYCNRYKNISISTLLKNGLGCICGDGISYPNKFVYYMLKQLNIEVVLEYSPKWANKKKYDIYIPSLNCIIENHGAQHYKNAFEMFGTTYEKEKQNDDYKENNAKNNGIKNYVVIDCRNSDENWIKKSILNSDLINIIGFTENDVNWKECDKFATSNLVKVISEYWNQGMCFDEIKSKTNLSRNTIFKYLNKGSKFSFCDYSGELSKQRTRKYRSRKEVVSNGL